MAPEKEIDLGQKTSWAREYLAQLKSQNGDPHLALIEIDELSDKSLSAYYDFNNGMLSGEEIEKAQHNRGETGAVNESTDNLYAMMLNRYLGKRAEEKFKKIA